MIIHRYLIKQVLKNQIALLLVLLSILSSKKLISVLSKVATEKLSAQWIWSILGFGVPYMLQIIIPLSLFLSILITYGSLHANQEILAFQASGFSPRRLLVVTLWATLLSTIIGIINVGWLSPASINHERQIIQQASRDLGTALLTKGKFRHFGSDPWVIFVHDIQNEQLNQLFIAQGKPSSGKDFAIWVAKNGFLQQLDGSHQLMLNQGFHYQGLCPEQPLQITQFKGYQANIITTTPSSPEKKLEGHSLRWLWRWGMTIPAAQQELHWRLTLLACIPIMAILAVPLSFQPPRQHRMVTLLPALLLYLIYFLSQTLIRSALKQGQLTSIIWFWMISISYLLLAIGLNSRKYWQS